MEQQGKGRGIWPGGFFWGLYGLLFSTILFCVLFFNVIFDYRPLFQLALMLAWGLLLAAALAVFARFSRWACAHCGLLLAAVLLFIFLLQLFIGLQTVPNPMYDHGKVFHGAVVFATRGDCPDFELYRNYYHHYPNNIGEFLLLQLLFSGLRLLGFDNFYFAACLVGHLLFSLMLAAGFYYLKGLAGERAALFFLLLSALFLPLYFQSSVSYTDTYSIWTIPCTLLCAQKAQRAPTLARRLAFGGLAGLCLGLGAQIKVTVLITAVALILQTLFTGRLRRALPALAAALALFCTVQAGFSLWANWLVLDKSRAEEAMPATHWLMMGLQGDGSYNWVDEWYVTCTVSGRKARIEKNLQVIGQRLAEMGPAGYCRLLYRKTCRSFGSGTADMSYNYQYMDDSAPVNLLYELVLEKGRYYALYNNLSHSFYLTLCLLGVAGAFFALRHTSPLRSHFTLPLALTGFWAFMMLWESNHRQLINQWPLYLMLAALGLCAVYGQLCSLKLPGSKEKGSRPIPPPGAGRTAGPFDPPPVAFFN